MTVGIGGRIEHWSCAALPFDEAIKFNDSLLSVDKKLFVAGKPYADKEYTIDPMEVLDVYITDS